VRDFVGAFRGAGLRLIVFFDGGVDDAKLDEWLSRRKRDLSNCDKALRAADMQSRRAAVPCARARARARARAVLSRVPYVPAAQGSLP
jgi:hypothetical protein